MMAEEWRTTCAMERWAQSLRDRSTVAGESESVASSLGQSCIPTLRGLLDAGPVAAEAASIAIRNFCRGARINQHVSCEMGCIPVLVARLREGRLCAKAAASALEWICRNNERCMAEAHAAGAVFHLAALLRAGEESLGMPDLMASRCVNHPAPHFASLPYLLNGIRWNASDFTSVVAGPLFVYVRTRPGFHEFDRAVQDALGPHLSFIVTNATDEKILRDLVEIYGCSRAENALRITIRELEPRFDLLHRRGGYPDQLRPLIEAVEVTAPGVAGDMIYNALLDLHDFESTFVLADSSARFQTPSCPAHPRNEGNTCYVRRLKDGALYKTVLRAGPDDAPPPVPLSLQQHPLRGEIFLWVGRLSDTLQKEDTESPRDALALGTTDGVLSALIALCASSDARRMLSGYGVIPRLARLLAEVDTRQPALDLLSLLVQDPTGLRAICEAETDGGEPCVFKALVSALDVLEVEERAASSARETVAAGRAETGSETGSALDRQAAVATHKRQKFRLRAVRLLRRIPPPARARRLVLKALPLLLNLLDLMHVVDALCIVKLFVETDEKVADSLLTLVQADNLRLLACREGHLFADMPYEVATFLGKLLIRPIDRRLAQAEIDADADAFGVALAVAVKFRLPEATIASARARHAELSEATRRKEQRVALGVGHIPYPNEFLCPITYDRMDDPVRMERSTSLRCRAVL